MSIYEQAMYDVCGMQKEAGAPSASALKAIVRVGQAAVRNAHKVKPLVRSVVSNAPKVKPGVQAGAKKVRSSLKSGLSRKLTQMNSAKAARNARIAGVGSKLNPPNYSDGLTALTTQATSISPKLSPSAIETLLLGGMGGTAAYLYGKKKIDDTERRMVDEHNQRTQGAVPKAPPPIVEETKKAEEEAAKAEARRARTIAALKDRQSQEKQEKEFNAANDAYTRALFGAGGVLTGGALGAAIAGEGNRLTGGLIGGGVGGGAGLLAHYLAKKYNLV